MANHTYSKGLLYKKTLNSSGEVTGSVPLLLKTLGSLVIMSDGTDAETAISTAISNMVTPDETTIVTGQDGITISVKKSTSAEIDEILGDVPTEHTWEGYYTKSETEALIDAVDDKISQSGIETALGYTPIPTTAKGSNNGVAELDATGKVPASQLPSYVDDVIESATYAALPATGEAGKIYVTLNDDKTYRWSGSAYVEISASLALGETSSTAYRGDRGKTAYDHSQAAHARTDATNAAIVSGKLNINGTATNIGDFKAVSTAASQGLTDTEKTNALANIGAVPNSDLIGIVDNGVKNIIDWTNPNTAYQEGTGIVYTNNSDGTWTVAGTKGSTTNCRNIMVCIQGNPITEQMDSNTDYVIQYNSSGTGNCHIDIYGMTDTYNKLSLNSVGNNGFAFNSGNYTDWLMRLIVDGNAGATINFNLTIMLTTKSQYNISPMYEPYAIGNQYLTPELIELCDSGAKNLQKFDVDVIKGLNAALTWTGNVGKSSDNHITITLNSDNTITVVSDGSNSQLEFAIASSTTNPLSSGSYVLSGCPIKDSTITDLRITINTSPQTYVEDTGNGAAFTYNGSTSFSEKIVIRASKTINAVFKPMICTKAAFGVSSKFVPYRPNWDLVYQNIKDVNTVLEAVL